MKGEKPMDFTTVLQAISTVGFPIVICIILLWYIKSLIETHKAEMDNVTEAIKNNTLVIQRLCDKMDVETEV